MNDKPNVTGGNATGGAMGGMGGLLTTLAGSGDKMIQLLIVGVVIMNTYFTKQDGAATRKDVDKVQQAAAKQIRTIFTNQQIWASYAEATVEEHRLIMDKLGIPENKWPRMPPMKFEEPNEEDDNEDSH